MSHCVQLVVELKWWGKAGGDAVQTSGVGSRVWFGLCFFLVSAFVGAS